MTEEENGTQKPPRRTGHGCFKAAGIIGVWVATTPPALTTIVAGIIAAETRNPTPTLIAIIAAGVTIATGTALTVIVRRAIKKNAAASKSPAQTG